MMPAVYAFMHEHDWLQQCIVAWGSVAFGADSATDPNERVVRFLEEAIELGQAEDVPKDRMHALVDYVYARDRGETTQEVGGVQVTLLAFCEAKQISAEACLRSEFLRVVGKDPSHFRKRNEEKKASGVTTFVQSAA